MVMFIWIISAVLAVISAADIWHQNADIKKSYFVSMTNQTWAMAKDECEQRNAKLAVIVNEKENNYLHNIATEEMFHWLGLKRGELNCTCNGVNQTQCQVCRRSFVWYDDTPMDFISPWSMTHPWNIDNRNCGMMAKLDSSWISANCDTHRRYACQYDFEPDPCHIERCVFDENDYECVCESGFMGQQCDRQMDECESNPCQNNGNCIDAINSYSCVCIDGFTGLHCETNIDDCLPEPKCMNNGICKDGVNHYDCECLSGFTGQIYESEIDECALDPCKNGGLCIDLVNSFICNCTGEYSGHTCEEDGSDQDNGQWYAFFVGVALLGLAFVGMVITIVIYIRTKPTEPIESNAEVTEGKDFNGPGSSHENAMK